MEKYVQYFYFVLQKSKKLLQTITKPSNCCFHELIKNKSVATAQNNGLHTLLLFVDVRREYDPLCDNENEHNEWKL